MMVANRGAGTVSFIDPTSLEVTVTFEMPDEGEPMYIAYDYSRRSRILVADRKNERLVVAELRGDSVDLTRRKSKRFLPLPAGTFHTMSTQFFVNDPEIWEKTGPVAVTSSDVANESAVYDMRTLRLIDTIPLPPVVAELGGKPHDLTISGYFIFITYLGTSDGRGYVASYIRSGGKYHLLSVLETAADPHVAIRDGTELVIAAQGAADGDGEVLFVRAPELVVIKRFVQPSPHGTAISFDSRFIYITNIAEGGENAVITYDMATREEVPGCAALTTSEPVPHNPAVTLDGGRLFITHSGAEATVTSTYEIDASGCPVQSSEHLITTGLNPFGICVVTNALAR
eukprot:jgi/Ulvmu1/6731/UM030_0066.1